MKQNLLAITIFLLAAFLSNGQNAATPNAGFESWTQMGNHFDPDSWNNLNPSTAILGVFTCTRATGADVHSGSYAIKLTTKMVFTVVANGVATTGTLITLPPYGVTGGIAYAQRPDSITGWYKYTPGSTDSGFVQFSLFDAIGDTIGYVRWSAPNQLVSTYTRFSKEITYFSGATPVTSQWLLSSSRASAPVLSSSIYLDDLDLVFNSNGIQTASPNSGLAVNGTLADNFLIVKNNTLHRCELTVTDQTGKLISTYKINNAYSKLPIKQLKTGIYIYRLTDLYDATFINGKFIKVN